MMIVLVRDSSSCNQADTRADTPEVYRIVRNSRFKWGGAARVFAL